MRERAGLKNKELHSGETGQVTPPGNRSEHATPVTGQANTVHVRIQEAEEVTASLAWDSCQHGQAHINHQETSDSPKSRGIPQNKWPVVFKNLRAVEEPEMLGKL